MVPPDRRIFEAGRGAGKDTIDHRCRSPTRNFRLRESGRRRTGISLTLFLYTKRATLLENAGVRWRRHGELPAVIRKAFRMRVDRGAEAEYQRRHNPIWPELEATLVQYGVQSYSIFLDPETNDLFAYAEIDSEERWKALASTEVCRRWWQHMCDLMPTKADRTPVSNDLREVFHVNACR
jgi:L-rhamnose mutarotase